MVRTKLIGLAAVLAIAVTACGGGGGQSSPANPADIDPNATLRYSTTYGTSSWDPHKTKVTSDVILLNNVYEPLVRRDAEGKAIPGLAESWQLSQDTKKLTLKLRSGATFTDGEPVNAAAAKKNLERAKEKDSITANLLALVTAVNTPDESTVELQLNRPGGALPLVLSDLPGMLVSPKAMANPESLKTTPVGAGPFKLVSQQPGAKYELEANAGYWKKGTPKVKKMTWDIMVDPQTRLNAIQSSQLDVGITATNIIEPAKQQGLQVKVRPSLNTYIMNFNQRRSEFGKLEVRQAIFYAIDRNEIVKGALEGQGEAGSQMFPKGYFGHDPSLKEMYEPNLDKAKELLAKGGVPNGFTFEAVVLNQPVYMTQAEIIKARLAKIGVTMNLRPLSGTEVSPAFFRGEADAIVTAHVGRPDPTQTLEAWFAKESPTNPSKSEPAGLREAIDQANSTTDNAQRTALIGKASKLVMENALIVPLAQYNLGSVYSNKVAGYEPFLVGDEWRDVGVTR
ncbi:ABC transporter substrate-binding protein [Enemella dayhoffiae]|uniref:ABC transporter substrate-binding protein n=1 Tax=Enemella dayhoffiae TaxID=2016507 RepID=A0A255GL31_9ACTN|nr:ABC transporter substrate-binding protein [Enemella dayhoffiae]OYO16548.1 ABC transporter substrate-binding protein [Enemella dayhoffiae]